MLVNWLIAWCEYNGVDWTGEDLEPWIDGGNMYPIEDEV